MYLLWKKSWQKCLKVVKYSAKVTNVTKYTRLCIYKVVKYSTKVVLVTWELMAEGS